MALFDAILEDFLIEGHFSSVGLKAKLIDILAKIYNGKIEIENADQLEAAIRKLPGIKKVEWVSQYQSKYVPTQKIIIQTRFLIMDMKDITYQLDVYNHPMKTIAKIDITKIHDPSICNIPDQYAISFLNNYVNLLARKGFAGYASISKNKVGIYAHVRAGMYTADAPHQHNDFERFKPTIKKVIKDLYNKGNFEYIALNELKYIG